VDPKKVMRKDVLDFSTLKKKTLPNQREGKQGKLERGRKTDGGPAI